MTIVLSIPFSFETCSITRFRSTDISPPAGAILARTRSLGKGVAEGRLGQDILDAIAAGLAEQHPETNRGWTVSVTDLRAQVVGSVQRALYILLGAVGFVLLIGCANVANLLLARITHRARELAVRAALGAGRWAALRLVLCESLVLAALGGGVGFLLSFWGLAAFVRLAPAGIPRLHEVTMDGRVLAFAIGISVLASLLFGAAGFAQATRETATRSAELSGTPAASRMARPNWTSDG